MGWILGDKFNKVFPHKGSIRVLWETKWKFACEKSVYPFHDGNIQDFAPIFEHLIKRNINDALSDNYTKAFIPVAESLEQRASTALDNGDSQSASELLLRAAVVYRISRFPYVGPDDSNGLKRAAYDLQKKAYLAATSFWPARMQEHFIPFTHRSGTEGTHIPIYVRVPNTATLDRKVPCILILTGLDGYRPDNSQRTHEILKRGWGVVICEIPGTADSPADPADPASPDRLLDSILQYMASRPELDMSKIVIWGLSAGGFYAVRAAHTHSTRLAGCIAHGPGIHHFLDAEWLSRVEDHEYPFPIVSAWAKKYGYDDPDEFRQKAQEKFSLIRTGIVDQPSCRLLLLNGMDDGITPIEDCLALFTHGTSKEGRFYPGLPHMGYPDSLVAAYKWLDDVLGQNKCSHLPN